MYSVLPAIDVPPQPWTGRFDGDTSWHRRWWQAVKPYAPSTQEIPTPASAGSAGRPAVVVGFCSDEGVRRNKGRVGAAAAPAAIRTALGPLAFHGHRAVFDAGNVTVEGDAPGVLEAGQQRAGQVLSGLLDDGNLTVMLGGGHETAYASYLGVAGSAAVRNGARLGILNLDAHFDLRDELQPSSGTPFLQMAQAEKAAGREFRYGVVGVSEVNNTRALFDTARRLGVRYLLDEDSSAEAVDRFVSDFLADVDVLYLTIDLDVLPAETAPGVSAPAAYGVPLSAIAAVCRQVVSSDKLLHCDVAELNPQFDVDSRTARVAARLVDTLLR